jgi:predicted O-methyltransferase YrrM
MNDTLTTLLKRFNLDPAADYSKLTMPLALNMNRRELAELFAELGLNIGAEIGTAGGEYAELLCQANPGLELYCVDAWQTYAGYRDYARQTTLDDLYESTVKRLAPFNAQLMKGWSTEMAVRFPDGSLDFCYIDCNHAYESVVADIAAWLPKIRSGGIIAGHDYSHPKGKQFGVVEAVTGWTKAYHVAPWFVCRGEWEREGDRTHNWLWVVP